MLPADHRLRERDSFRRTTRSGRRAAAAALVVHLLLDPPGESDAPPDPARVGFVVGKIVGNAVTRNRVRRRLRAIVRNHLASLPAGSMLVVRALPGSATASSAELDAELGRCLHRALAVGAAAARTGAAS